MCNMDKKNNKILSERIDDKRDNCESVHPCKEILTIPNTITTNTTNTACAMGEEIIADQQRLPNSSSNEYKHQGACMKPKNPKLQQLKTQSRQRSSSADSRSVKQTPVVNQNQAQSLTSLDNLGYVDISGEKERQTTCESCGHSTEATIVLRGSEIQSFYSVWKIKDTGSKLINNRILSRPASLTRSDNFRSCGCATRSSSIRDDVLDNHTHCLCLRR